MNHSQFTVAIAGSTKNTLMCAQAIKNDTRFSIQWVLTPTPRRVGRKQELVENPLHLFAQRQNIQTFFIEQKIDAALQELIVENAKPIDFLLVVDFGYIVPNWLLALPKKAPINIHPSDLPKYRGSSPGQFVLLFGEKKSAVSVIIMNNLLDQGELIAQPNFEVLSTWTSQDYYQFAFTLISEQLPNILTQFGEGQLQPTPQPLNSPTMIARRLTRDDGFVSWELLKGVNDAQASELLQTVNQQFQNWPQVINNAVRAFSPWPGVWTLVPTAKGEKRMKILSSMLENNQLLLDQVQIEGQSPSFFEEVKNQIK